MESMSIEVPYDEDQDSDLDLPFEWRKFQFVRAKLKTSSRISGFFAAFGIVAVVEVSLKNEDDNPIPTSLLMFFGLSTVLLLVIHLTALVISSCILPQMDVVAECEEVSLQAIAASPHKRMAFFVQVSWYGSTGLGIVLFFLQLIAIAWAKFWEIGTNQGRYGKWTAFAATLCLATTLTIFLIYLRYFFQKLNEHLSARNKLRQIRIALLNRQL